jgi:hypothetical protein
MATTSRFQSIRKTSTLFLARPFEDGEHHRLGVPQQWHRDAPLGKSDHLLQHAPAVRPRVDVAVRENQRVGRRRGDDPDQGRRRRRAAVTVSDGDGASFGHAVLVPLAGGIHFTGLPILRMASGKTSASRCDSIHVPTSKRSIE